MAKLSTSVRASLPSGDFAGPGRSFPIPDLTHARKAVQLGPRAVRAGHLSMADLAKIKGKVKRKFPSIKVGK